MRPTSRSSRPTTRKGLHDIASNPVYPGFHSMPLIEISMNKAKWDSLDEETQNTLTESVKEFSRSQVAALKEKDLAAVEEAEAGGEVTVSDWSEEDRARFRSIAAEQWKGVASESANAQKVYDTLTAYLESEGLLSE